LNNAVIILLARLQDASKQDIQTINTFRYRLHNYTESKATNKTVNCCMLLRIKSQFQANRAKWVKFQDCVYAQYGADDIWHIAVLSLLIMCTDQTLLSGTQIPFKAFFIMYRWHTDSRQCSELRPQTAPAKATGDWQDYHDFESPLLTMLLVLASQALTDWTCRFDPFFVPDRPLFGAGAEPVATGNRKAQLSLTNTRDACEKFARFT